MKIIEIEKELDLSEVKDILEVHMKDHFTYQKEQDGMRCVGPFYISGKYSTNKEVKSFSDVFEFDVFAGNDKLDGDPFRIEFEGYDYSVLHTATLYLHFKVYGIYDDKSTTEAVATSVVPEVLAPVEERPTSLPIEVQSDVADDVMSEEADVSMMEELFDDKDNVITSYSFVVVKPQDTYTSIADRYGVEESDLRQVNHDKEIHARSLIVLPYAK